MGKTRHNDDFEVIEKIDRNPNKQRRQAVNTRLRDVPKLRDVSWEDVDELADETFLDRFEPIQKRRR